MKGAAKAAMKPGKEQERRALVMAELAKFEGEAGRFQFVMKRKEGA